ncbi:reticulon-like protein B4 [Phoenix dactylifera]|uniref:Reticulon-like protein n=1 Tax=Phoenix dactylifera TaxID=42345 RepID=A0A8B7CY86_PHODC|nr:reticulon-like protein B4 [Phoenix dactylifera]
MSSSSSSTSDGRPSTSKKLFGREKPLHDLLGGGKGADIVLWRNKPLSAGILAAVTVIWLLFEVVGYHLLALLCHMTIVAMLAVFIWDNGADLVKLPSPSIPGDYLPVAAFREVVLTFKEVVLTFKEAVPTFQSMFYGFMFLLRNIAYGKDLKSLLLAVGSLWLLSVIGSCWSFLGLLYFVCLCIQTLPALYETYEDQVDDLASKGIHHLKELLKKFREDYLPTIPRGSVEEKKVQ